MSDRQITRYGSSIKDNINKIQKVEGSNIAIGGVGYLRELQQIFKISRNIFNISDELTQNECIQALGKLTNLYRENYFIEPSQIVDHLLGTFIAIDSYNINVIDSDLAVLSGFEYYAIGSGEDLVMGYLNTEFKDISPSTMDYLEVKKILEDAIKISCKDVCSIDDNLDLIALYKSPNKLVPDSDLEIINKCEYDIINKKVLKTKKVCNGVCKECFHHMKIIYSKASKSIKAIVL